MPSKQSYGDYFEETLTPLIRSVWFESTILLLIIASCVLLAISDPQKDDLDQARWLFITQWCLNSIFFVEMILKMLAFGIGGYFKDGWNWCDFIVVMEAVSTAFINILQATNQISGGSVRFLAVLRAIRPLRAAQYFIPMRLLLKTFILSVPAIVALGAVIGVVVFVFGTVGSEFFSESLHYRCFDDSTDNIMDIDQVCGGVYSCPGGYTCKDYGFNPAWNSTSFDSMAESFTTAFSILCAEGWVKTSWYLEDGIGLRIWPFTILLMYSGIVLMALFPAIITTRFYNVVQIYTSLKERKRLVLEKRRLAELEGKIPEYNALDEMALEEDFDHAMNENENKDDFKKILNQFDEAEKEDIRMINKMATAGKGSAQRDPLILQYGSIPPYSSASPLLVDLRVWLANETGPMAMLIYLCVFADCSFLALNVYPPRELFTKIMFIANVTFSIIFYLELLLKFVAFGPLGYIYDNYNCLDAFVTVISSLSLVFDRLRLFVLLRILRLIKIGNIARAASYTKEDSGGTPGKLNPIMDLPRVMQVLLNTFSYVLYLYIFLFIAAFVFSICGRTFYSFDDNLGFDSFFNGNLKIFFAVLGEDFESEIEKASRYNASGYSYFMLVWLLISRFFILNFIVAIVIYYVDLDGREYLTHVARGTTYSVYKLEKSMSRIFLRIQFHRLKVNCDPHAKVEGTVAFTEEGQEVKEPNCLVKFWTTPASLGIFPEDSLFRHFCLAVVDSFFFQNILLIAIVLSALSMGVEVNYDASGGTISDTYASYISLIELAVTGLFVVELLLYSIGLGLYATPKSYLKGGLPNWIDFVITILSTASLAFTLFGVGSNLGAVKVVRALRVFRILRLATRSKVTRFILNSSYSSLPAIMWVFTICGIAILLFAILGINCFSGYFFYCDVDEFPSGGYRYNNYSSINSSLANGCPSADWVQYRINYENFAEALLASFITFTFDDWKPIMEHALYATGYNYQPHETNEKMTMSYNSFYYVLYFGIVLMLIPLFVGVQYGTFLYSIYVDGNLRKRIPSVKDAEWAVYRIKLSFIKPLTIPQKPSSAFPALIYKILESAFYRGAKVILVIIHCIFMYSLPFKYDDFDTVYDDWANASDYNKKRFNYTLCVILFYILDNFILRPIAYGKKAVCGVINILDISITLLLTFLFFSPFVGFETSERTKLILDLCSMLVLVKIFQSLPTLAFILSVVRKAYRGLSSIIVLIFIATYIYGIFGIILFADYADSIDTGNDFYNNHIKFNSTLRAILILTGVASGDDWTVPLLAYADAMPPNLRPLVYIYFCSYVLLIKYFLVNMILLVILQKFEIHNENKTGLAMGQVREFKHAWHHIDHEDKAELTLADVAQVVRRLGRPLGTSQRMPITEALRIVQKMYYLKELRVLRKDQEKEAMDSNKKTFKSFIAAVRESRKKGDTNEKADEEQNPLSNSKDNIEMINQKKDPVDESSLEKKKDGKMSKKEIEREKTLSIERQAWENTPKNMDPKVCSTMKMKFKDAIISIHQNAIFRPNLNDEPEYRKKRRKAQEYLALVKEGVWGTINAERAKSLTLGELALRNLNALLVHNPQIFRHRLSICLAAASHRWCTEVRAREGKGYTDIKHLEGNHLLEVFEDQLTTARLRHKLVEAMSAENADDRAYLYYDRREIRALIDTLLRSERSVINVRRHYVELTWERGSVEIKQQFRIPRSSLNAVVLAANGELMLTSDADGYTKLFRRKDIEIKETNDGLISEEEPEQKKSSIKPFKYLYVNEYVQDTAVLCLAFSSDNKKFFTGGKDNFIRMYSRKPPGSDLTIKETVKTKSKKKTKEVERTLYCDFECKSVLTGHHGEVYAMKVYKSLLCSVGQDGHVNLWRIPSTTTCLSAPVPNVASLLGGLPMLFCVTIFEDVEGKSDHGAAYLVTGGSDGIVSCFVFYTEEKWIQNTEWQPTLTIDGHAGKAVTAVTTGWTNKLFTGASDGSVKVWDFTFLEVRKKKKNDGSTGSVTSNLSTDEEEIVKRNGIKGLIPLVSIGVHASPISSFTFTGGILFSCSHDMSIVAWHEPEKRTDPNDKKKDIWYQNHDSGLVQHTGAITSMSGNQDCLVTVDLKGGVMIRSPSDTADVVKKGLPPLDELLAEQGVDDGVDDTGTMTTNNIPKEYEITEEMRQSTPAIEAFRSPPVLDEEGELIPERGLSIEKINFEPESTEQEEFKVQDFHNRKLAFSFLKNERELRDMSSNEYLGRYLQACFPPLVLGEVRPDNCYSHVQREIREANLGKIEKKKKFQKALKMAYNDTYGTVNSSNERDEIDIEGKGEDKGGNEALSRVQRKAKFLEVIETNKKPSFVDEGMMDVEEYEASRAQVTTNEDDILKNARPPPKKRKKNRN